MKQFLRRLVRKEKLGTVGLIITVALLLVSIFSGVLAPYGMNETNMDEALEGSSARHLLGTDNLGRDILSRILYGSRITVIVGLSASLLSTCISLVLGGASGYFGGAFDLAVQRLVDIVMSFPATIILMALMAIVGGDMLQIILVMGLRSGIVGARLIRSSVLEVKENVYVEAARATGCTTWRILWRHIVPHIASSIIVLFTTRVPNMVMTEASLSFLGFGIPAPNPTWGGMLSYGREYMIKAPHMVLWPGLALSVVVFGVNMLGDALRDMLDPRMKDNNA